MGCAQLACVMEMTSTRKTRSADRYRRNGDGHGMSYTALADAMICTGGHADVCNGKKRYGWVGVSRDSKTSGGCTVAVCGCAVETTPRQWNNNGAKQ